MESNYLHLLEQTSEKAGNILCFGIDPVLQDIPVNGTPGEAICKFYNDILDAIDSEDAAIPTIKPNIAFFEQYGFDGLRSLKAIIERYKEKKISVILDAKRGDIGKTSGAYAKAAFDFWEADAVTVNPYMGSDSVGPFIDYAKNGKGVYALVRTSNKGGSDFQDLVSEGRPLYRHVAEKLMEWHVPGVGAVVGATYPAELENLAGFFSKSGKQVPMLIPGVGSQGGDADQVMKILRQSGDMRIHRVNSSSGISYAYKKTGTEDYAGAAVKEIKILGKQLKI